MDGRASGVGARVLVWVALLLAPTGGCADALGVQPPTRSEAPSGGLPDFCDDDSQCSGTLVCQQGVCTDLETLTPTNSNLDRPAVATTPAGGLLTDRPGQPGVADPLQPAVQTRGEGRFTGAGAVVRSAPDGDGRDLVLTGELGGATHELRSERFTLIGGF